MHNTFDDPKCVYLEGKGACFCPAVKVVLRLSSMFDGIFRCLFIAGYEGETPVTPAGKSLRSTCRLAISDWLAVIRLLCSQYLLFKRSQLTSAWENVWLGTCSIISSLTARRILCHSRTASEECHFPKLSPFQSKCDILASHSPPTSVYAI